MSYSAKDDADRHIMPGPPWVRKSRPRDDHYEQPDQRVSESSRADQSLRSVSQRAWQQNREVEKRYEFSATRGNGNERDQESWPPTLDPVVMPPPPADKTRLSGLGMVIKFGGAVSIAACAAFAMMNAVQLPSTGIAVPVESGGQSSVPVFGGLTEIASAQARALATPEPPQTGDAPPLAAVPYAVAAAQPVVGLARLPSRRASSSDAPQSEIALADTPPRPTLEREASLGQAATRLDLTTRPASAPEERRTASPMTHDEMSTLLKRGQSLIAAGDIASARLILTRLAEAGSVDACLALAGTFDAGTLAGMHVVGVQPDPAKARAWYLRAAEQGSAEARRRLQQSSVR